MIVDSILAENATNEVLEIVILLLLSQRLTFLWCFLELIELQGFFTNHQRTFLCESTATGKPSIWLFVESHTI